MHQLPRTQTTRADSVARPSNVNRNTNLRDSLPAQTPMPANGAAMEKMGAEMTEIGQPPDERQNLQHRNASKLNQIIQVNIRSCQG